MKIPIVKSVLTVTAGMVLALGISATSSAVDKGGTLSFVVAVSYTHLTLPTILLV